MSRYTKFRSNSCRSYRFPGRFAALLLAGLVQLFIPLALFAGCLTSGLGGVGETMPETPFARLTAEGEDLIVEMFWSDPESQSSSRFVLLAGDREVADWPVELPVDQLGEQRLAGAFQSVTELGFQYRLQIQVDDTMRATSPLRVMLDCPAGGECRYRIIQGLTAGDVVLSPELMTALAEAESAGSSDLLGWVAMERAWLAAELPGFAWQWQQSGALTNSECTCRWLDIQAEVLPNAVNQGASSSNPPTHRVIRNAAGAGFAAAAQSNAGTAQVVSQELAGSSTLGIQLLCTQSSRESTQRVATTLPSLPELEYRQVHLQTCPTPCVPHIAHQAELVGCAEGMAIRRDGNAAVAEARMDTVIQLGSHSLVDAAIEVVLDMTSSPSAEDQERLHETSLVHLNEERAIARIDSSGMVKSLAGIPSGSLRSYAFASTSMEFEMWFQATASCGEVPPHFSMLQFSLNGGIQEGGVAIERWEDY